MQSSGADRDGPFCRKSTLRQTHLLILLSAARESIVANRSSWEVLGTWNWGKSRFVSEKVQGEDGASGKHVKTNLNAPASAG